MDHLNQNVNVKIAVLNVYLCNYYCPSPQSGTALSMWKYREHWVLNCGIHVPKNLGPVLQCAAPVKNSRKMSLLYMAQMTSRQTKTNSNDPAECDSKLKANKQKTNT